MSNTFYNPKEVSAAIGGYSHGVETSKNVRILYISGQVPETRDGEVPVGFEAQCEAVWANIKAMLSSADMDVGDLVKVTTYLTSPGQADMNSRVRKRYLGEACAALTVVVVQTLNPEWLLEIEAVATQKVFS